MGRVFPGIAMAVVWVVVILAAPLYFFWLSMVIIGAVGLYEYYRMACPFLSKSKLLLLAVLAIFPLGASVSGRIDMVAAALFISLLGAIVLVFILYSTLNDVLGFLSLNGFGVLYISFSISHIVLTRSLPDGNYWLIMLTAITVLSDTGAYYGGRTFGKRKLCPNISPNKTIAGAVSGVVAGIIGACVVRYYFFPDINVINIGLLGLALSVIGIMGDLTESVAKRSFGVKDSGVLLAGHGGLLDRIDSLLLTSPVLYYLLWFKVVV